MGLGGGTAITMSISSSLLSSATLLFLLPFCFHGGNGRDFLTFDPRGGKTTRCSDLSSSFAAYVVGELSLSFSSFCCCSCPSSSKRLLLAALLEIARSSANNSSSFASPPRSPVNVLCNVVVDSSSVGSVDVVLLLTSELSSIPFLVVTTHSLVALSSVGGSI